MYPEYFFKIVRLFNFSIGPNSFPGTLKSVGSTGKFSRESEDFLKLTTLEIH